MRRTITLASGFLFLVLLIVGWQQSLRPEPHPLTPQLTGQVEYCLTCHADLPEISPSHPVETFGCVRCHGGERLALDADLAHSTMRGGANPSDLSVVEQSCGGSKCHSGDEAGARDHIQRVRTSVQATYTGAITNIRYTFGAQPDLSPIMGIHAVDDEKTATGIAALSAFDLSMETNPVLEQFAQNCLTCHLYAEPREGDAYTRFTGCAACHTPTRDFPSSSGEKKAKTVHTLTTEIAYTQCNACHNRGNYDLRTMTFVPREDVPTDRIHNYYQPIAQFTQCEWTLDCIDCHTREEAMGDGDIHGSQADMQYVQCKTCHGTITELPKTKTLTDPDDIAFRMALLNPVIDLKLGDTIIITEQGEPLWNTRMLPDGSFELFGKASGQRFLFRPVMGTSCEQKPDEQASRYCHQCHAIER